MANKLFVEFPQMEQQLPEEIHFVHSEELVRMYPDLSPKERETEIVRKYGAVFLIGIGGELSDGKPHDTRAADYDDWSSLNEDGFHGLNGDILVWNSVLQSPFELSSMGIRVDEEALIRQLEIKGENHKKDLMFHKMLLAGELPSPVNPPAGTTVDRVVEMVPDLVDKVTTYLDKKQDHKCCSLKDAEAAKASEA